MKVTSNLARTSVLVTVVLFVGYIIAFLRETIIAYYFGVSADVDAYTIATTVPINLISIITLSIQSIVVPIYSKIVYNHSREEVNKYVCSLINIVALISLLLIVICEIFAKQIVFLFAPGFDEDMILFVTSQFRIVIPTVFFSLISFIFIGIKNVHKSFILPSLSVYLLNISIILALFFLHVKFGIYSACIGQVIGTFLQFSFLYILAKKHFNYSLYLSWRNTFVVETGKSVVPIIWSTCIGELNAIVNRMVCSFLFVGSIAALNYAGKINSVLMAFFTSAIATVVYPLYAESSVKNDFDQLNSRINITLSAYSFFLIPLMFGVFCLKREIIEVAFARGAFDNNAVELTQSILGCYVIGLLFMAIRETITKVYYSLMDTKTPAKNATIGVVINILLSISLPFIIGVEGVAIASTVSAIFISVILVYILVKRFDSITINYFFENLRKLIFPTTLMTLSIIAIKHVYQGNSIYVLLICFLIGFAVYMASCFLLKVPIVSKLVQMLKNK